MALSRGDEQMNGQTYVCDKETYEDFIQVVESGNATIAIFKLFSMYSQEQLQDLRDDFEAIVRIMENTSTETAVPRPRKGYGKYVCYQKCPNV